MLGLGFQEILVVLIVCLIFVGPDKLPELARTLGKFTRNLRHTADEIKSSMDMVDIRQDIKNIDLIEKVPPIVQEEVSKGTTCEDKKEDE